MTFVQVCFNAVFASCLSLSLTNVDVFVVRIARHDTITGIRTPELPAAPWRTLGGTCCDSPVSATVPNAVGRWTRYARNVGFRGSSLPNLDETDQGGSGTDNKTKQDMDDMDVDSLACRVAIVPLQRCQSEVPHSPIYSRSSIFSLKMCPIFSQVRVQTRAHSPRGGPSRKLKRWRYLG